MSNGMNDAAANASTTEPEHYTLLNYQSFSLKSGF